MYLQRHSQRGWIVGMRQIIAKLLSSVIWGNKKLTIVILGLDNVGMAFLLQLYF